MPMPPPSMFRARKKKPGEMNPPPQNANRMTGPPMQQGPGQGSMFADGRKGQAQGQMPRSPNMPMAGPGPSRVQGQPQYQAPPTPNYPRTATRTPTGQMQGQHPRGVPTGTAHMADGRKPMMADGGMDEPDAIGGAPDDQDQGPMPGDGSTPPPPAGAGGGQMPIIKPEAVGYHDDEWTCDTCQFFSDGGQCQVLQMQVSPKGACQAFEPMAGGGDQAPVDTGAGFSQNDDGGSGSPSLS